MRQVVQVWKYDIRTNINLEFIRGVIGTGRFTLHDTLSTTKNLIRNPVVSLEISEIAFTPKLESWIDVNDIRDAIPE